MFRNSPHVTRKRTISDKRFAKTFPKGRPLETDTLPFNTIPTSTDIAAKEHSFVIKEEVILSRHPRGGIFPKVGKTRGQSLSGTGRNEKSTP